MSQISQVNIEKALAASPKLGNPAVVGLAGFGLTTLLLQFHNLGLAGVGPVVYSGLIFGGVAQLIAGLQERETGNNFGYTAFTSYGCFWISLCGILLGNKYEVFATSTTDLGWFLVAWTLYTVILWAGSWRISKAMTVCFTTLLAGFILLDFAHFGFPALTFWAGVDLVVCAGTAWYMMAHLVLMDLYGRDVLPVGKPLAK